MPQELLCFPSDSKSIKITWSLTDIKSEIIEGFYIGYKALGQSDSFTYKTMMSNNNVRHERHTNKYEYVIDSLMRHTKYAIVVQAFNSKGAGPASIEVITQTFSNGIGSSLDKLVYSACYMQFLNSFTCFIIEFTDPPEAPLLKLDSVSNTYVSLSWEMPFSDVENTIDGFILSYKSLLEYKTDWDPIQLSRQQRTFVLKNLRCGSEHVAKVEAFNEVGQGKPSEELRFSTTGKCKTPVLANLLLIYL